MAWVVGIGLAVLLFFAFPRQMGVLVLIVLVLIVGTAGYLWLQGQAAERDRAQISATASADPAACTDPQYPIALWFENRGRKTVEYVSFNLVAHRPGFSTPAYTDYASWDRIMAPGQRYGICWSLASYKSDGIDPPSLNWSIDLHSARFR